MTLNINDPAGVQALLDQLRGSQAWKEITATIEGDTQVPPGKPDVASLLSQLQSSPSLEAVVEVGSGSSSCSAVPQTTNRLPPPTAPVPAPTIVAIAPSVVPQDFRLLTFQQALPRIAELASDQELVAGVKQMKKEQDDLERQLWEDRRNIYRKYEEKVKAATTRANMTGESGLSKHEAEMLQTGLKKELERFDRERILVAWDGLISKQQTTLEHHGVPTMFRTNDNPDRERQQHVMRVLEGIVSP